MAKLLDGTRIYGSANIDNNLIVNTMNIVTTISTVFDKANTSNITADAAFGRANVANTTANTSLLYANLAFDKANSANVIAVAVFAQSNVDRLIANTAYDKANSANVQATAAYGQANSVFSTSVQKTGNTMTGNLVFNGANATFVSSSNNGIYWVGNNLNGSAYVQSSAANTLIFGTQSTEKFRIDSTTNLTISANVLFYAIGSGTYYDLYSRIFGSTANIISFYASSGEQIRVNGVVNSVNYLRFSGAPAFTGPTGSIYPYVAAEGTDTDLGMGVIVKGNSSILVGGATNIMRPGLTPSYMGYSTSYRSLILGSANTTYNDNLTGAVTISLGASTMNVAGGSFSGDGREIIVRRNTQFTTQNSGGQNWQTVYDLQPALYHRFLTDGGEQVRIKETTGAVNYFILTGATTASNPSITVNAGGITLQPSTGNTLYITSNTGIGTSAPGNYGLQVQNGSLRVLNDRTTGVSIFVGADTGLTANATNYFIGVQSQVYKYNIPSANNDAGYRIGGAFEAFVSDTNFVGSLASQYGVWARHGHNVSGAGSRITNSYGVYIEGLTGGSTTITNFWGLYQTGVGTKNYFQGLVGIGATSPGSNLTVTGNATISTTLAVGSTTAPSQNLAVTGNSSFSGNVSMTTSLGIGTTTPSTNLDVVGAVSIAKANVQNQTLTDGATITWDTSLGQIATVTLANNRTMANATNMRVGTYILKVVQDGTGGRTLTWNTGWKWTAAVAPTLTTAANSVDIFTFYSDGTLMYGSFLPDVR